MVAQNECSSVLPHGEVPFAEETKRRFCGGVTNSLALAALIGTIMDI